ncbi:MAG: FtsW/RodA/SpoVE family cell cycle protein [Clostridia bacterium]|nr:FtsW/RodA/SpoVE family cell cycle protein [Clostridia bacterium]
MEKLKNSLGLFFKGTDTFLILSCIVASFFGLLFVHSATLSSLTENQVISRDTFTMIIAVSVGIVMAIMISLIDYEVILKLWPIIAGGALILMLSLFVFGVGPDARSDAKTWLKFGSFYFQPSELVKIGFVITLCVHIELVGDQINKLRNIILLCLHAGLYIGLVVITGDIGSSLVFVFIFVGMMFIADLKTRYFAIGILAVIAAIPLIWTKVFSQIQKERFLALLYPENYPNVIYQQEQCIKAIGSGRIFGKGLFKGSFTQSGVVPERQNDMILSVVGEELGLVGCILLLVLFFVIILRIVKNARLSKDNPGMYLCYGIATMFASQIIINIGMCLELLPVIGITLPFMSAGGSSNLCIYIAIGVVLSVYRHNVELEANTFSVNIIKNNYKK